MAAMSLERAVEDRRARDGGAGGRVCWVAVESFEAGELLMIEAPVAISPPGTPLFQPVGSEACRTLCGLGCAARGASLHSLPVQ